MFVRYQVDMSIAGNGKWFSFGRVVSTHGSLSQGQSRTTSALHSALAMRPLVQFVTFTSSAPSGSMNAQVASIDGEVQEEDKTVSHHWLSLHNSETFV